MTCKNSFYRSILENLKRRLWLPAVIMLYFFFAYPIKTALSLSIENPVRKPSWEELESTRGIFEGRVAAAPLVMCVLFAVMCAMQGFSYLHKKSRVDMYHSVPVSKRRQYAVVCLNGLLIYTIPYLANLLFTYLIGVAYRAVTVESMLFGMRAFGYSMLLYLMVYFTTVIAMGLTGNGVIAFILAWILLLYEPAIQSLLAFLKESYFHTYVESGKYHYMTPIAMYLESVIFPEVMKGGSAIAFTTLLTDIVKMSVYIMITCLFGYLFYAQRPSEACGRALAFPKSKVFFKFLLVVPFGVIMGAAFYGIANKSLLFALIGLTIGVAISHCILEVIYEFDIRSVVKHRLQLLILFGVTCLAYSAFQFDLFGYDRYMPIKSRVESAYIQMENVDTVLDYYDEEGYYRNRTEYLEEHMYLTDIDAVIKIASASRKNESNTRIERKIPCMVAYRMKNGETVKRRYYVDYDVCKEQLGTLYKSREYKNGICQYGPDTPDFYLSDISYQIGGLNDIMITAVPAGRIMKLYEEEMQQLTLEEVVTESPVGMLTAVYESEVWEKTITYSYPVYPSFTKVQSELKKEKALNTILTDNINTANGIYAGDVDYINVIGQDEYWNVSITIEEPAQIRKVLDGLYYEYGMNDIFSSAFDGEYLIQVRLKDSTYYTYRRYYSGDYYFKEGEVPSFIIEAIKEENRQQRNAG